MLEGYRGQLGKRAARMEALNPLSVLSRGFAMVSHGEKVGKSVTRAASLKQGEKISLRFSDGAATATVEQIYLNSNQNDH